MSEIKKNITDIAINFLGQRTNRKIVVIESDDWGSLRMPSRAVYDYLVRQGFDFTNMPYERVDSIATEDDLTALFQVLNKYKDSYGNHPVFTALSVSANPDFNKIRESGFDRYFYVTLDETLADFSTTSGLKNMWEEGIRHKVFYPQFHGREHLNVPLWMRDLKKGNSDNYLAFENGIPGIFERNAMNQGNPYAKAFRYYNKNDLDFIVESVKDGLSIFERLWGFKSLSFMAPSYTWNDDVETAAAECGVRYIQTAFYQNKTINGENKVVYHYFGQKNIFGQRYLLRNCSFEPTQNNHSDSVIDKCLKEISIAFTYHKPATISSHRLNYIGRIDINNRDKSLRLLDRLLSEILRIWPDVVFMNSVSVESNIK